jgi:hypothetical protein
MELNAVPGLSSKSLGCELLGFSGATQPRLEDWHEARPNHEMTYTDMLFYQQFPFIES